MIGKNILNYQIIEKIGHGGMGRVYLAQHMQIERKVAIKILDPTLANDPSIRQRFKNEASTLSLLQHPNIVTIYDYVEDPEYIALIMEYVDGVPMNEYIQTKTGPIPEERAVKLFKQILEGVAYAHLRNIVHRDLKPSNFVITEDDKVKILDFGIAKILGNQAHQLTKTGSKVGTIIYMSPEQVKGEIVDNRSDIYSLGVTLFQMITGEMPYNPETTEYEIYSKIVKEPLPDPRSFYEAVSENMVQIISKATQKDPNQRYLNCDEFNRALSGITPVEAPKPDQPVQEKPSPQQKPVQSTNYNRMQNKPGIQQQPPGYTPPPKIRNYLVLSILTTLFCCLPFGIIAIIQASSVNSKLSRGDIQGAFRSSRSAKNWAISGIIIGFIVFLIYFFVIFVEEMNGFDELFY